MKLNEKEIICIFYLYPIATKKCAEIKELFSYSLISENRLNELNIDYKFYSYIVEKVESWLNSLFEDEKEIIDLRFFKNMSFSQIAYKLNYRNHSSTLKKIKSIIQKIEKYDI